MVKRTAPLHIDEHIRLEIDSRLAAVEQEGVRLLLAVESGSRAWGFPSPDSDYDVRFMYVRPRDWYLALEPGRDVIEQPITDDIDLNGWDIRKTLGLLLGSNAIVSEWLSSPIRYRPDDPATARLIDLVRQTFNPRGVAFHYANLGQNAAERWLGGNDDVPVKRYFYALRPALAIRTLRLERAKLPPMNLQDLVVASDLPETLVEIIQQLVEAKSRTRELGNARRSPDLDNLIRDELSRAAELPERLPSADDRAAVDRFFLDLVNQ
ncbi:MAG TPA: nucleotidyltransferase domain-containing protein [Sphingomicrobium sp.]|nr:nucleotidyltransferase domain-containing protein [Sphingomicrobium sp.]